LKRLPDIKSLAGNKEIYVATQRKDGKRSTAVPVWFALMDNAIWFTTSCATGLAAEFRRQIQRIPLGDELLVTTGDPSAKEDLPPLARMMGHTVRSIENARDGSLVIDVERGR
jgi:TusA-related sulfurtransferase